MAPRVSSTRQVIQTDGLTSGSNPITRARRAQVVMPQYFYPFNMEDEHFVGEEGGDYYTTSC
jgi:hypothetical protein